jgi:hypothetical protein
VSGAGGLDQALTVGYIDNVNAGVAHASASFAGDDNHTGSYDSATFTIEKADVTVEITWANSTFDGSASSASAAVMGPVASQNPIALPALGFAYYEGSDASAPALAGAPKNAGTYTVVASFAGNGNYNPKSASKTITIGKASSTTSVTCPAGALTYNGSARTPCSAKVTGAGGLSQALTVGYIDNVNAGTAHASASFAGDDNHTGSNGSETFTINKAAPTVNVTWASWTLDGTAHPATATVTGPVTAENPLTSPAVTFAYYSGSSANATALAGAPSGVGTFTVRADYAGNPNYTTATATKTVTVTYRWDGFLQPINDTAHQTGVAQSKFKLGQTIPAKFVLKNAQGVIVQQVGNPTFSRSDNLGACDANAVPDTITEVVTADAGVVYTWDGAQYHYNWSTKSLKAGEYRIYANLADGTKNYVDICLN